MTMNLRSTRLSLSSTTRFYQPTLIVTTCLHPSPIKISYRSFHANACGRQFSTSCNWGGEDGALAQGWLQGVTEESSGWYMQGEIF
jgi:hypothetical protein